MKILKFLAFVIVMSCFFLTTIPLFPIFLLAPSFTRSLLVEIVSFYSWIFLGILAIKVNFKDDHLVRPDENYLIVSNHLSYLDVLILSYRFPSCFVTSKEVKNTPFLGQIVSLAGCLFVDRKDRRHLKDEINELRDALHSGLNVAVFPEATSTNGDGVLRFRRPLFESSLATGKSILPLTINYQTISHQSVTYKNRDLVCWYGEMDFFPHFLKVLEQKEISVEVVVAPAFKPELIPAIELALKSHQIVSHSFKSLNSIEEVTL